MSRTLYYSTGNKGKLDWARTSLGRIKGLEDLTVTADDTETIEIQSDSLAEISRYKARQCFDRLQRPVISTDAGLYIAGLNGFPGPFGKFMIDRLDITQWGRLVRSLESRQCEFKQCVTLIDAQGTVTQFHDTTGDIFMFTDTPWPQDHPKQWSKIWRFIVPSGLGFDKPMAAFSDGDLQLYMDKLEALYGENTCLSLLGKHILANPACLG